MSDKICVDIGDKVENVHTGEVFVVEHIFSMKKIGGGKYTPNKKYSQKQLLSAYDWKLLTNLEAAQRRA